MTSPPVQPPLPEPPHPGGSGEIADAVRAAVLAVPGVADLHSGSYGEVATYLPGRKVQGVRMRAERAEVHVVLDWGSPALATADAVRRAASAITATAVDVHVQDFAAPPGLEPDPDPGANDDDNGDTDGSPDGADLQHTPDQHIPDPAASPSGPAGSPGRV